MGKHCTRSISASSVAEAAAASTAGLAQAYLRAQLSGSPQSWKAQVSTQQE